MDSHEIRRVLLEVVGSLDAQPAHSFSEATTEYRRRKVIPGALKPRTIAVYNKALDRNAERWGDLDVNTDFYPLGAELYAVEAHTAWRSLQMLRGVLILAQRIGWRREPHGLDALIKKAEYLPREAVYDAAQLAALLWSLEDLDRIAPLKLPAREVVRGLVHSGCRLGEIRCLSWDEIHPGYLRLRDSKTGPRVVPISAQVQLLLGRQRVISRWVFPGRNADKPVGASSVQRAFYEARDHAGIKDGCVHTVRHSFASECVRNGVPIQALQKIMGHRTGSYVTNRYIHMDRRDASMAVAVFANAIANAKGGRS